MLLIRHAQSEWNLRFSRTRIDAGPPDPVLTPAGREQARAAAALLAGLPPIRTIVASPYRRCLETAVLIADRIGVPVRVDALVRERCAFSCDRGSPPGLLGRLWPELAFDHLDESWWGRAIESQPSIRRRAAEFRDLARTWPDQERALVVTHWGFLRALTGLEVENGTLVRYDPTSGVACEEAVVPA
ncbi:MAG TPA: histidine phosphatase family protein [Geminicoccus sp.]|uniref:histidine phosphatase family protein n=1 Tax=Geminicoccus sp. TaxID=2024832 RepID=UPI002BB9955D|nr:histidine phosphatase family protein [Geminicoccus sp.]HWL69025.1 histidine phosphatase family protein [Geminicoccus sp.]